MFLNSLNIPSSGLTAQRLRMDVISQNIANQDTTVGTDGQPYRRHTVTLQEKTQTDFQGYLDQSDGPGGVQVSAVSEDPSDLKLVYDPSDPSAGADGYVRYPNVDAVTEMTDLMESSRSYHADVTAFNALKGMAVNALDIGK